MKKRAAPSNAGSTRWRTRCGRPWAPRTATVLAQAIVNEGMKLVAAGANPMMLKRGIEHAVEKAVEEIKKRAIPVAGKAEITNVAAIAGNDREIGQFVAAAMDKA